MTLAKKNTTIGDKYISLEFCSNNGAYKVQVWSLHNGLPLVKQNECIYCARDYKKALATYNRYVRKAKL